MNKLTAAVLMLTGMVGMLVSNSEKHMNHEVFIGMISILIFFFGVGKYIGSKDEN